MKKWLALLLCAALLLSLGACTIGKEDDKSKVSIDLNEPVHFSSITLGFVPSSDSSAIFTTTEKLPELLKKELAIHGINVDKITVEVGESYDATGEAMVAGDVDIGWLPGGTYAVYSDDCEAILTATRAGLTVDSTDATDWNNESSPPKKSDSSVSFYRALIYATSTEYGKKLASKVANGEELTWEDLNGARWAIQKVSSSAGYIYPNLWLMKNYDGKQLSDLSDVTALDAGYSEAFAMAANGKIDVFTGYADCRLDYAESWTLPLGSENKDGREALGCIKPIWHDIKVIGVTDEIYNDAVAISKQSALYTPEYIAIIQQSLIDIINSPEGSDVFRIYNHTGYARATDADYDNERAATVLMY